MISLYLLDCKPLCTMLQKYSEMFTIETDIRGTYAHRPQGDFRKISPNLRNGDQVGVDFIRRNA